MSALKDLNRSIINAAVETVKYNASMEAADDNADVVDAVAKLHAETVDIMQEAAQNVDELEGLGTIAAALEAFYVVEASDVDVVNFKTSLESFAADCDVTASDIIPSIESFKANSHTSLALSLEAINGLTASMEAGLFNGIRRMVSAIGTFFSYMLKSYHAIEAKIKQLRADIAAKDNFEVRDISVSNIHRLQVGGKSDPATIIKGLGDTLGIAEKIYGEYLTQLKTLYKSLAETWVNNEKRFDEYQAHGDAVAEFGNKLQAQYGSLTKLADHNPEFSGGFVFASYTKTNVDIPAIFETKNRDTTVKRDTKSLTKEQALKVLSLAEKIINVIRSRSATNLRQNNEVILALNDAWEKDSQKNPGFFNWFKRNAKLHDAHWIIHLYQGDLLAPINGIAFRGFGAVNAAVGYVAKSIK